MGKNDQRIKAIDRELAKKGQGEEIEKLTIHFYEIGDTDIPPADGKNIINFVDIVNGTNWERGSTDADRP